ncbi:hypothetical protein BYT27DRAFT_7186584 [Phlegmacium glaucopus]|nr:hypothetical protein BYT27DRAFT_7186584 [Phlegmacium glaucopus]
MTHLQDRLRSVALLKCLSRYQLIESTLNLLLGSLIIITTFRGFIAIGRSLSPNLYLFGVSDVQ